MKSHGSLNHISLLVWNKPVNDRIALAEQTRGRGQDAHKKHVAPVLALARAFPLGPVQEGPTTTNTQASSILGLDRASFHVSAPESVNCVQPSAESIAGNRIMNTQGSQFIERLKANGPVCLITPNGILFSQSANGMVHDAGTAAAGFRRHGLAGSGVRIGLDLARDQGRCGLRKQPVATAGPAAEHRRYRHPTARQHAAAHPMTGRMNTAIPTLLS